MLKNVMYLIWFLSSVTMAITVSSQETNPITMLDSREQITLNNIGMIKKVTTFGEYTKEVIISPDGNMMTVASQQSDYDYAVSIYDLQTLEEVMTIQGHMDFYRRLVWSPDSTRLAIVSARITGAGVQITSVKTYTIPNDKYMFGKSDAWYSETISLTDSFSSPVDVAWHPDSIMIAVGFSETVHVYDGTDEDPLAIIDTPHVITVDWSPDGDFLMTQTSDGVVEIWGVVGDE